MKISQNTALIHWVQVLVGSMLQNVKTALVSASDRITGHRKIVKKGKKIEGILTKFSDQRLYKKLKLISSSIVIRVLETVLKI